MNDQSRIIKIIGLVSFMRSFGYGSLWSFIVLYLNVDEKISLSFIGFYLFIVGLIGAFSQIFFGALTDSYGRKIFLIIGQVGQGLSFFLFGFGIFTGNIIILLLSIFLQSIFSSMVFTSFNAIIADIFEEEKRFRGYAFQRALANFGWGIGPAIGGMIYQLNDFSSSFILLGIFLSFISIIFRYIPETNLKTSSFRLKDIIQPLKNRYFLIFSMASFLTFVLMGQLTSTYSVYENRINNISVFYIGLTWTMNGLLVGVFQYPSAKMVKRKNAYYFLIYGSLIYGFGYMMLPFNSSIIYLFTSMIVITIGEIIYSSSSTATALNFAKENERGKYAGSFGFFTSIGRYMGPFYGGLIFLIPLNYMFRWSLIFILAVISSSLYLYIFLKNNHNKKIFNM